MATMKTLRLRRNVMKLAIYRHFANIVVFMVVGKFCILTRVRNQDKFKWARLPGTIGPIVSKSELLMMR